MKYSYRLAILHTFGGVLPHGTITVVIGGTILLFCDVTANGSLPLGCHRMKEMSPSFPGNYWDI